MRRSVLALVGQALVVLVAASAPAHAQGLPPPTAPEPFRIVDNSFIVEEAFNQEAGIFQNIFGAVRIDGRWAATFTQEWPVKSQTHQFSYTLAFLDGGSDFGVGDTLLNYRYQASTEGEGRAAFAPRISLILPTGRSSRSLGNGSYGLQVNLPLSKQTGDWYWHLNGGITWLARAVAETGSSGGATPHVDLASPFVAGSGIYRLRPMLHVMVETLVLFQESYDGVDTSRSTSFTLSPGVRGGWDLGDRQLIVGAAMPVTREASRTHAGAFLYASYELPFRK